MRFRGLLAPTAALLRKLAEFGYFFFTAASEASFLELQIAELLFVLMKVCTSILLERSVVMVERRGKFHMPLGEDGVLETRDALQTPHGVGNRLHKIRLSLTDR